MNDDDRRMIEHEIPLKAVNFASGKEKKHPRRHVELIHQWPARRPRSACRVAIAAALLRVPKSDAEFKGRLALLEELAPYECSIEALKEVRKLISAEYGGRAPKVLDMFAGGGAIPLEAANLGCEAHAVELNPVAHIIELATCVYPQKYRMKLADLVEKWGQIVIESVRAEIGDLYAPITMTRKRESGQLVTLDAVLKQVVRDATGKEVSVAGIDPISRLYVVARMQFGEAAADYDSFKNLAIGALPPGTELDGMKGALMQGKTALLAKKGNKVTIRGFLDRGDGSNLGLIEDGKSPPLVDVLHRLLWLQQNRPANISTFLRESQADLESVRLLAQALGGRPLRAEPRPGAQKDERTDEQRAIDTFLASFQDLTRRSKFGPLFQQPSRVSEDAS